jgi:hypothetical protein
MRLLTKEEQDSFREDFRETEKEIQKYIGVYLSGLILVTGWIVGPQSKPVLEIALGNSGYNVLGLLLIVILNVIFISFLIYKSLIVHEIMQFMAYLSDRDSGFNHWESWRRSPHSATKPVRTLYTILLGVLPLIASVVIMLGTGLLLFNTDPAELARQLNASKVPVAGSLSPTFGLVTPEQLASAFRLERWAYVFVLIAHVIPFIFFYHNVRPTNKRWDAINRMRGSDELVRELILDAPPQQLPHVRSEIIRIYDKETGRLYGEITGQQLKTLSEHYPEPLTARSRYYLDKRTIEMLESVSIDVALLDLLRGVLNDKEFVEITFEHSET